MKPILAYLAAIAIALLARPAAADCIDLRSKEPLTLSGQLSFHVFPGSPNFTDVTKGDYPEPTYILNLADPICLAGDDFADPSYMFTTVHLIPNDGMEGAVRALVNRQVDVTLVEPMAANTGHHHAPLVVWVKDISAANDPTSEYGTAATSVRGFYEALSAGSGDAAAQFIAPERRIGPFAPQAMTRYYGAMVEPLTLLALDAEGPNRFLVSYRFRSRSGACQGRALVTTIDRGGSQYIWSIQALNGC